MDTTLSTILAGTAVFIVGESLQRFYFEPIKNFKGIVGEIDSGLFIFQNILVTRIPDEAGQYQGLSNAFRDGGEIFRKSFQLQNECRREMRRLGGNLKASCNQLPWIYRVSKKININEVIKEFTFLYNNVGNSKNADVILNIRQILKI